MILVDTRDGSNELIPLLAGCSPCLLPAGDICIPGNGPDGDVLIGVEVKKIDDLLQSITNGRLSATQLPAMVDNFSCLGRWLLTVGEYRNGRAGRLEVKGSRGGFYPYRVGSREVPWGYVEGFLIELQTMGFGLKQVASNEHAAEWLERLDRFWSKPWLEHKAMKKFDVSARNKVALMPDVDKELLARAEVFKDLPGLGWERAMAAAEHFPTVIDAMISEENEWAEVRGIGKVLAKAITRFINGK